MWKASGGKPEHGDVAAARESVAAARSGEAFGRVWRRRAVRGEAFLGAPLRYEAHTCVAAAGWRQRTRGEALSVRNAAAKRCRDERLRAVGGGGPAVVEALCDAAETCGSTLSVPTP